MNAAAQVKFVDHPADQVSPVPVQAAGDSRTTANGLVLGFLIAIQR